MATPEDLTGAVCAALDALSAHVEGLSSGAYCEAREDLAGASVGAHVRHCLDHFQVLSRGLRTGRFDYDDRARDRDVECDRACALARARQVSAELRAGLRSADLRRPVEVRTASSPDGAVAWQHSSLGRELQFVISHTVHHAAMIAVSCRARGLPTAEPLGVAAATLRHRRDSADAS